MKCLFSLTTIFLVQAMIFFQLINVEAKKKLLGEYGEDFEFVDEFNQRPLPLKNSWQTSSIQEKRWIHDPTSDLCRPLNCRKREICLLEDEYSAVCVLKKELHKNGNEVMSKSEYLKEKGKKHIITYKKRNGNDEKELESSNENSREDDVFYENNIMEKIMDDDEGGDEEDDCKPCPVAKPSFLCGSDNRTYSSLCRLDYHNCIHSTTIKITCKGFCPCKDEKRYQRTAIRESTKYKKTLEQQQQIYKETSNNNIMSKSDNNNNKNQFNTIMNDKEDNNRHHNQIRTQYMFTPEEIQFDNKHYKYLKYISYNNKKENLIQDDKRKLPGFNEVVEKTQRYLKSSTNEYNMKSSECKPQQLTAIGNRLLDWFSVIMADSKKRRQHSQKSKGHFPPACKTEAKWMFVHLDLNNDGLLSLQEMYDLEHDQNERCIKPFIDTCDLDKDNTINTREWCRCFEKTDRPCAAVRRRISSDFAGAYAPDCDVQGFYKPTQCHNSVGVCWCVDKHGVEFANTRTRGKPNCDAVISNASSLTSDDEDGDVENDSAEGSADQMLVF